MHRVHRALRVRAMFSRTSAAGRMVRDFHQRQTTDTEEHCLGAAQLHEDRPAERHRRFAAVLKLNGVVDTPRRARTSSAQAGDHGVAPAYKFLQNGSRRTLHVCRLGFKKNFGGPAFPPKQFGQFLKHRRGIRLAVVDDPITFPSSVSKPGTSGRSPKSTDACHFASYGKYAGR